MTKANLDKDALEPSSPRPGKYSKGSKTVDKILQAALEVLLEEGSAAFTMKRIAAKCGFRAGNVTRHFPRKDILVNFLLNDILESGEILLKQRVYDTKMPAEEALFLVITESMESSRTKHLTHLITELWTMSNHNEFVAQRVEALYRYVHTLVGSFVKQLNPSLNADQVETVSLLINATMEGGTVLAGYNRPWEAKMPLLKNMAAKSLINTVKTITSDEIETLRSRLAVDRRGAAPVNG